MGQAIVFLCVFCYNIKKGSTKDKMYYRHTLKDKYVYPDRSDEHMINVKHLRDTHFDENFEYLPKGFWHKVKRGLLWVVLNLIVFPVVTIRHGLKIHGKRNLRPIGLPDSS